MTLLSLGYRQWENPGSLCSTTGQKRSRKYSHKAAEEWTRSRFERLRTKVCFPFTNVLNTSFVFVPVFIICVELQEASTAWISWKGFVQAKKKMLSTKTQRDDGQSRRKCVCRLVSKNHVDCLIVPRTLQQWRWSIWSRWFYGSHVLTLQALITTFIQILQADLHSWFP